jgi:ribonucleoside-diphosphate reductase alpha chain
MNIKVTKRNGKKEPVMLDKIVDRITQQTYGLDGKWISPFDVAQKVIAGVTPDIKTSTLDQLATETAASLTTKHPDYSVLAARLAITALHKDTKKSFSETVKDLYNYINPITGKHSPIVSESFNKIVKKHADELNSAIVHSRDHNFDYFGFKTLEKSYLLKINGEVAERPQYMYMRTAIQVWGENLDKVIETYNTLSEGYYTHATPTLFNSGTIRPQLSSCFLLDTESDSIEGIFNTLKESAQISKNAGGIGISFNKVRSKGTYIAGTNGTSNGIIPFLKIFNETARAVDQGGGKRKGSIAIYMEPWHADIMDFLDLRKNQGKDEIRARDLFLAVWNNDLFMERIDLDEDWSLMCPHECSELNETYGKEFRELYLKYESEGRIKKTVKAREVWNKILESQIETGTPYILYKDSINEKSNQSNIGIIRSSNLCLDGDTLVKCRIDGVEKEFDMVTIDVLFKNGEKIEVLSRDLDNDVDEWCLVENSGMTNNNAETIKITDENGNYIICTEDHQVWTQNRGYVRAGDLEENDNLLLNEKELV